MANLYDKVKKKAINKAYQNRVDRATKKAKEYNNGKLNKTQQNYVKGDIKSSSSTRAYGYKTYGTMKEDYFQTSFTGGRNKSRYAKQQKGENPYELKYVYTGEPTKVQGGTRADGTKYGSFTTKKRRLTNDEKEAYKQTGDIDTKKWKKNYKYQLIDGVDSDGKNFRSNLNLTNADGSIKWDGMNVARNRVKAGGSKWNYVGGFLKDTVGDFIFDSAKVADRYFGSALQGILGVAETVKGLTDVTAGVGSLSKVNFRQGLDNIKSSIEESNKTGWAKSSSDTLREANTRYDNKVYEHLLKTKGQASADAYMKSVKKAEPFSKALEGVAGFGIDVLNPLDATDKIKGATKIAKNNAIKSAKEIVTGTGSQAVAFLPKSSQELYEVGLKHKDMLERMKAYKNYLQEEYIPKFGKNVDETKAWKGFENSRFAEEYAQKIGYEANGIDQGINRMLDNGFNRAMVNDTTVKEVTNIVKSNPQTQNLGRFLDEIGTNVDKGVQRHIDGRKLNAKRTQVKDGYVPQMLRGADEVDNVSNVDKNQLSMFNRNGNTNTYVKNIKPNNKKYNEWYNAYNDENMLFDMIDDLSDSNADGMLDWLSKNKPDTYARYMGDVDDLDNIANDGAKIFEGVKSRDSKALANIARNSDEIKAKPKYDLDKFEQLKEENAIEEILRTIEGSSTKVFNNSYTRNNAFKSNVRNFADSIMNGDVDLDDLTTTIDNILGSSVPPKVKREFIINRLFNGDEIIKSNVSNNELDSLLKSITDIIEVKRAENIRNTTGELVDLHFSDTTKNFFKMLDDEKVNLMSGKIGGVEMNETAEIYEKLLKGINDRSRSLTDNRYADKLELLAREFGYKNYNNDILFSIEKLQKQRKALDSQPLTREVLDKKLEVASNLKRLKEIQVSRDELWKKIRNMTDNQFDKFINDNYPQHMKGMDSYSPKANQTKELEYLSKDSTVNKGFNEVLEKNLSEGVEAKQSKYIDDLESVRSDRRSTDITKDDEIFNESKLLKSVGLEPVIRMPNLAKNYKPTYSHLEKMPGAKHVISNVKKLLTKIVDYDTPVVRKIDGKMQIAPYEFESKTLRKELNKQIEIMRKAGIKDYMWFEEIKKFKADLIKNTERGKLDFNELKGVSVNKGKKIPDDVRIERDMNNKAKELFIQDEYERILNASNPEELFMSVDYDKYTPSHGDNIGVKLSDKSEHKNLVQFDELVKADVDTLSKTVGSPQNVSKTPLDDLAKVKADDSYNPFAKFTENFDAITKKGKEIKLPEDYTINQATGEATTKEPSKEIQKLMDYVEEEKLFSDFNESIGNDRPSFEKFKEWFKNGSDMPYNDNKAYDLYKRWLNSWKKGLTIYNPGWHVKNFFQNKGQSYLDIGMDAFGSQKNAREMFKNMRGLENNAKGILQKDGTYYSPSELTKMAKRSGIINGFNDLIKESRGLIPPLETAIDNSKLMKKLSMSEETARLHHFLTKIERGATPEEAVKSVNKYLFDYSKQNKFDRFMSDFVDPFWTYHKNNAKLVSKTGITSPIRTSNILRGTRGLEHGLDEKDRAKEQKRDLQAPFGHFVDKKNKDRYTYQYDMDLFPSLEEFAPIEKDDVMSKLNPILKIAYQQSQGVGNFDNKIVDKEVADWGEVTKKERNEEMFSEVNPFMNPLVKAIKKSKDHDSKAKEGKQSQETSNKQILMDWLEYIFGNKGNYYRDVR